MRYAKIADGNIVFAPSRINDGDCIVYNPTVDMLVEHGYMPVRFTEPPVTDDDHTAVSEWTQGDGEIVQRWVIVEIDEEDISAEEVLSILTGESE